MVASAGSSGVSRNARSAFVASLRGQPTVDDIQDEPASHKGIRLIVCGGRRFRNVPHMWSILDSMERYFAREGGICCVIDGMQQHQEPDGSIVGADYWAHQWAIARNKPTARFDPDWIGQGKSAGPKRNQRMIDEGYPDACIGFDGGRGTADMLRRAEAAKLRVWRR